MLYRILTENRNSKQIEEIVSSFFESYTMIPTTGIWKRALEFSLIIEIDTIGTVDRKVVEEIAKRIKELNHQEAVMIQEIPSTTTII